MIKKPRNRDDMNISINSTQKKINNDGDEEDDASGTSGMNFFFNNILNSEENINSKLNFSEAEDGSNQDAIKNLTSENENKEKEGHFTSHASFENDTVKHLNLEETKEDNVSSQIVLTTSDGQQIVKPVNVRYKSSKGSTRNI